MSEFTQAIGAIQETLHRVIVGQQEGIQYSLLAVACGGHVLIEDLPGTGKTTLARSLAQVFGLSFQRVQGTTDKLPAEITGPLFAQFVLIDEINRLPPKSQSALLEAMEEGQVTVDNTTHPLPRPFTVVATQNPIDLEGTFPLLEPALDRFFVQVRLGYPTRKEEIHLHQNWQPPTWRMEQGTQPKPLPVVLNEQNIFVLRQAVTRVTVSSEIDEYLQNIIDMTRTDESIALGLSPRAGLNIRQAAQAWALLFGGRDYVTPDDLKEVLLPVGAHRLRLRANAAMGGETAHSVHTRIKNGTEKVAGAAVTGSWAGGGTSQKGRRA